MTFLSCYLGAGHLRLLFFAGMRDDEVGIGILQGGFEVDVDVDIEGMRRISAFWRVRMHTTKVNYT